MCVCVCKLCVSEIVVLLRDKKRRRNIRSKRRTVKEAKLRREAEVEAEERREEVELQEGERLSWE